MTTPIEPMEAVKVPRDAASSDSMNLVPGKMHCARCKFSLLRKTLYVQSGTVGAGGSETEPCPNGCGPLWPMTWEQEARDCYQLMDGLFERAKKAEDALAATAQVEAPTSEPAPTYVECRECSDCNHVGINDADDALATCHNCDWSGPSPKEDHCPGCAQSNCMGAACPKCGNKYSLLADANISAASQAPDTEQAKPMTPAAVDYIMEAVSCFADEWSQFMSSAKNRAEKHGLASSTKNRIRRMLEDTLAPAAAPAKPDLSGLTDADILAIYHAEWRRQHSDLPVSRAYFDQVAFARALLATQPATQAKPDASDRVLVLEEAEAACRTIMESYDNEHNRHMGVAQEMMECAGDCIDAINELKSVAATTSKPNAEGGGA